jgi:predicted amidohydrolase
MARFNTCISNTSGKKISSLILMLLMGIITFAQNAYIPPFNQAMKQQVKVAAAQILTGEDIEKNRVKIIESIGKAHEIGCEIIVFHEGCLTGYPNGEQIKAINFERVREIEREVRDLAARYKIAVLLGSSGISGDAYTNYVLIIDETGKVLGKYHKTWRAGEPHYTAGAGPVIFTVGGVESTIIICHDLRYPELARLGVAAGAKIVFIANNESGITHENKLLGYRSMQIARATENLVFGVMSNCPADPDNIRSANSSHGNSLIVDPLGNVLDEASVFEERLVVATLDLRQANSSPVSRILGENESMLKLYGKYVENPAYTQWIKEGLKLVRRLDGQRVEEYLTKY